ncbi:DNA-binding protein [Fusarium subglutinans]|uniref:DNA-binding protein n=1 Tax=Gibberella subglutinans TaxID=42677 RepID=A0A8H5PSH2_GIBSU|nr:DNA-binding protein [Fusarium subglutinans]KAF5602295.1 DNA-binding protein [Fusarium subglutinans]
MLLPSALPCDASHSTHSRLQPSLFSPPASPPAFSSHASFANIMTTCRSLQSLLSTPAPIITNPRPTPSLAQLPTPPLAHAAPPLKLRLRPRPQRREPVGPKKVTKRAAPRALNKRRRAADEEAERYSSASESGNESPSRRSTKQVAPSTPKRTRIAPEQLPLGLDRSDFHNMHLRQGGHLLGEEDSSDEEDWSAEDDRILIEIVLEKLRLSKAEWQDCARNLGRDRHAVDRRWKTLLLNGDIGLKSRPGH